LLDINYNNIPINYNEYFNQVANESDFLFSPPGFSKINYQKNYDNENDNKLNDKEYKNNFKDNHNNDNEYEYR
jgi:hypothetical protein